MPLFKIEDKKVTPINQKSFATEKKLQGLVEKNLQVVFGCRFVATEYFTGHVHNGRIDSLALSEDDNPVIIEYKNVESSELITQSLFYLAWLRDHKGDFESIAKKTLGQNTEIDWSAIRVICIAPNYRKYDLHAAQVMGQKIELWTYRYFGNETVYFEEVLQKSLPSSSLVDSEGKNPVMVAAGKKAAITKATATYTFEEHFENKTQHICDLGNAIHEFIVDLDPAIQVAPKKQYIAYKTSKNMVCMEIQGKRILLFLKLDPKKVKGPPKISRDVSSIGHFGTGDLEVSIMSEADVEATKPFIQQAYDQVGG